MPSTSAYLLAQLKNGLTVFDQSSAEYKLLVLTKCSALKLKHPKFIRDYHDCLLFILGYAENEELYLAAQKEMERVAEAVKKLSPDAKAWLDRSGLPFSETQGAYSFTLIQWLLNAFPDQLALHSFDEGGIHPKEVFKFALPEMEFELLSDEKLNPLKWLEKAAGTKNKTVLLKWMIHHLEQLNAEGLIKDQLFESLQAFVTIKPRNKVFSRGFGSFFLHENFYHRNGLLKKFDEQALINKKLPAQKKLSSFEKNTIIEKARVALFLLNRETDPVTYCNEDGLLFYELEHGLSIALFSMCPARRLPMESYIGFMMFKNGYPMAYGGGWVFGRRSLLGINIFEAFRGGESAFVFCQLLRTYRQSFGATYFEVEPYQFGKDNPEGIKSGAFWFYYRFGFRPVNKTLHELALKEAQAIAATKGYRSPPDVLKQFTASNIFASFGEGRKPTDPAHISRYISEQIALHHNGDRLTAEKWCLKKVKEQLGLDRKSLGKEEKIGFGKLLFFVAMCLDLEKLKAAEKAKLKEWMLEKGRSEFRYIALCNEINIEKLFVNGVRNQV